MEEQFGLFVSYSQMHTLELPALRDILAGSVGLFNNYNLCHVRTINWDEIITGNNIFLKLNFIKYYNNKLQLQVKKNH